MPAAWYPEDCIRTTWGSYGICDMYRFPDTEDDRNAAEALRLVPREPAPEFDVDADSPTSGMAM